MIRHLFLTLLLATAWALGALPLAAQTDGIERVVVPLTDPTKPVFVDANLTYGSITVEGHDGPELVIEARPKNLERLSEGSREPAARKDGLRRLPNQSFGFKVSERNNRVEIDSESWSHHRSLALLLRVPRRTSLDLGTVNDGEISVRGVEGELELSNTNGGIEARDIAGSVVAETTNGNVVVTFKSIASGKPMAFSTFNGNVDVTFPPQLAANLRMRSDRGEILTDFAVTVEDAPPRINRDSERGSFRIEVENETRATVGGGGPEIYFKTYNGDVIIRKAER